MQPYVGIKLVNAEPMERVVDIGLSQAGYAVQYRDGYESWSPAAEFEEAYRPLDELDFPRALWLILQTMTIKTYIAYRPNWAPKHGITIRNCNPTIGAHLTTYKNGVLIPWAPSVEDLLARDWKVECVEYCGLRDWVAEAVSPPDSKNAQTMRIKEFKDDGIVFDNGLKLTYYHDQDCCEHVYAEFDALKNYNVVPHTGAPTTIYDIAFPVDILSSVEGVPDSGFSLIAQDGSKWFVPCYNEQNGYYSSNLSLVLSGFPNGRETKMDVSKFVTDRIG